MLSRGSYLGRKVETHLFRLDQTMKEREAFEMFPRAQPHGVKIDFATNSSKFSKQPIGDAGHTPSCQERPG